MTKFIYVYSGGKAPESPEEGKEVMAKWMAWFGSMGDAVVDGGNPLGDTETLGPDGTSASGYSLVQADDLAAAVKMAEGCPMLSDGGSVQVSECLDM